MSSWFAPDSGEMGLDELRAAFAVYEPRTVPARHFVQRRVWDLVDRAPSVVGGEVWGVRSPDEHRGNRDRAELRGGLAKPSVR
jgi:hypothetical protein